MSKKVMLLFSMLCSLSVFADGGVPGIVISNTDSSKASIAIAEMKSIKFSDGVMIVNMKDDSQKSFIIDEIAIITFEDIATAINVLTSGNTSNSNVCITDVSGRTVFNGKAMDVSEQPKLPAGIYVVTANGRSQKIMIK